MSIDFWTADNTGQFWGFVRMLLETIQPGVMLMAAVSGVAILITIIVKVFRRGSEEKEEDYEIKHY